MARLLGGSASPIGWSVQFVEAPADVLLTAVLDARQGTRLDIRAPEDFPACLAALLPFEAPWTRELLVPCGTWTAYLNNFVNGGDSSAIATALARRLGVRCVMAEHAPRHGPGHEGTQLWLYGPDGEPPLMYRRTVSAVATDGRWQWETSGEPLSFEETDRYTSRRVRDRFDRPMLLRYLEALGIPADDDNAYGQGVLVQQLVDWPRRTVSLEQERQQLGLGIT